MHMKLATKEILAERTIWERGGNMPQYLIESKNQRLTRIEARSSTCSLACPECESVRGPFLGEDLSSMSGPLPKELEVEAGK